MLLFIVRLETILICLLLVKLGLSGPSGNHKRNNGGYNTKVANIFKRWVDVDDEDSNDGASSSSSVAAKKKDSKDPDTTDFTKIIESFNRGLTTKLGNLNDIASLVPEKGESNYAPTRTLASVLPSRLEKRLGSAEPLVPIQVNLDEPHHGLPFHFEEPHHTSLIHLEDAHHGPPLLHVPNTEIPELADPTLHSSELEELERHFRIDPALHKQIEDTLRRDESNAVKQANMALSHGEHFDVPVQSLYTGGAPPALENFVVNPAKIFKSGGPIHKLIGAPIHKIVPSVHRYIPERHIFIKRIPSLRRLRLRPMQIPFQIQHRPKIIIVRRPHHHFGKYANCLYLAYKLLLP